jgi:uncharacterized protein (DUF2336 family)
VQVRTDWFVLDIRAAVEQIEFFQTSLVDARLQPAKVVQRRWERDGADALPIAPADDDGRRKVQQAVQADIDMERLQPWLGRHVEGFGGPAD